MPRWDEIQVRAKKLIDEGMKLLRSGMTEASYLADATAKAANLHVSLRQNRFARYKAVHEIGKLVCDEIECDPQKAEVRLTGNIRKMMAEVVALDEEAKGFEAEIEKLTVIKKESSKPAGTAAKRTPSTRK